MKYCGASAPAPGRATAEGATAKMVDADQATQRLSQAAELSGR
jgi:hypothetical protein